MTLLARFFHGDRNVDPKQTRPYEGAINPGPLTLLWLALWLALCRLTSALKSPGANIHEVGTGAWDMICWHSMPFSGCQKHVQASEVGRKVEIQDRKLYIYNVK